MSPLWSILELPHNAHLQLKPDMIAEAISLLLKTLVNALYQLEQIINLIMLVKNFVTKKKFLLLRY
jgi:hypothetical protein